ncbi:hypothetical protein M8998_07035 [Sphingobacterium sp. lm-10]|uniref:hypothetical protein n=1 Tax=Sphingobacterium sp. lm-10 TaxID=2944904 RepID=UPI002021FE85|nr:hypothetical protein [Sphingobacterium sp. lm-10]MCL7987688.1 hypothetical protein [Sphingobacterium sp. lm-10]
MRSTSLLSSENTSWYPDIVNLDDFMNWENDEFRLLKMPFEEKHLLVIVDALENIREEDLIGEVWI